jgi:branched-chain amino acid transport system substrate-binding protein
MKRTNDNPRVDTEASESDRSGILDSGISKQSLLIGSHAAFTIALSNECETNRFPRINTLAPWQSWFFGRGTIPKTHSKSAYHLFWNSEDIEAMYSYNWTAASTDKNNGCFWRNDSAGQAISFAAAGFPAFIETVNGCSVTKSGLYLDAATDFGPQISRFKSNSCDLLTGVPFSPDFTTSASRRHNRRF